MTVKELAKQIRQDIKKHLGYSSRQVSVRGEYCGHSECVRITAKSLDIPLEPLEQLTAKHESFQRDYATGEILSGGNTYIDVSYHWEL
tara:strand:+ start:2404 stop:2667 length:264 start_codon:yes stop_codon:yes gene_type:complete